MCSSLIDSLLAHASYLLSKSVIASSSSVDLALPCSSARASKRCFNPLSSHRVMRSCVFSNAWDPRLRCCTCGNVDVNVDGSVAGNVGVSVSVSVDVFVVGCVSGLTNFLSLGTGHHLLDQVQIGFCPCATWRILIDARNLIMGFLDFNVARDNRIKYKVPKVLTNGGQHIGTHPRTIVEVRDDSKDRQRHIEIVSQLLHGSL